MHIPRHRWQTLRTTALLVGLGLAASVTPARAQAVDTQARAWAGACATCHATQGQSRKAIPAIAGVEQAVLLQKLLAFKRGELPSTVMQQHAKGYTDAELARLATYFSRQPR